MNFKKTLSILISLLVIISLSACGNTNETENEHPNEPIVINTIADLLDNGFTDTMSMITEYDELKILFCNEDSSSFYRVICPSSADLENKYYELDVLDENYEDNKKAFYLGLEDAEIECIDYLIPSFDEYSTYIGKTLGDIESEGFWQIGSFISEDNAASYDYTNNYIVYTFIIDPASITNVSEQDYIINEISFQGFEQGLFESEIDVSDCENNVIAAGTIDALYENHYESSLSASNEDGNQLKMVFELDGKSYFVVTSELTSEEKDALDALSFEDADYYEKKESIYRNLENYTVECITDNLPLNGELDKYVGKTIGELEDDGFTYMWEMGYEFIGYQCDYYYITVATEESTFDAENIRNAVITSITFSSPFLM